MRKRMLYHDPSVTVNSRHELNEYRKTEKFIDCEIRTPDGTVFKVHKVIIALSCPFFEKKIKNGDNVVYLEQNISNEDMDTILEYLYTARVNVSSKNARTLYERSAEFELKDFQRFCSKMIINDININNCLEFYRLAAFYNDYGFSHDCVLFIVENAEEFFDKYLLELTIDELQTISSQNKLNINQETLFTYLTKWIKENFDKREKYLINLIKIINFTKISSNFIELNILSDQLLLKNNEFFNEINKQLNLLKNISNLIDSSISPTSPINENNDNEKIIIKRKKSSNILLNEKYIYLVTNSTIDKLDFEGRKKMRQFYFNKHNFWGFSLAGHKNMIYISGGCYDKDNNDEITTNNITEQYNFVNYDIIMGVSKILPEMRNSRFHRMIEFKGKIYSCGGYGNSGAVDIYDIDSMKWIKGGEMNEHKCDFGIVKKGGCMYAVGGYISNQHLCETVERFDSRENDWYIISKTTFENYRNKAVLLNDSIYCFDMFGSCQIFDIRANKFRENIVSDGLKDIKKAFWWSYDVVEYNEQIFGIFQSSDETTTQSTWKTYLYDRKENVWNDLKRPLHMTSFSDVNLSVL